MDGSRERTVQVLIIEDHAEFRAGLHFFLSNTPGLEVRSAEDAASGLALMEVLAADVVIMDIQMPGTDGIGPRGRCASAGPGCGCWCAPCTRMTSGSSTHYGPVCNAFNR